MHRRGHAQEEKTKKKEKKNRQLKKGIETEASVEERPPHVLDERLEVVAEVSRVHCAPVRRHLHLVADVATVGLDRSQ